MKLSSVRMRRRTVTCSPLTGYVSAKVKFFDFEDRENHNFTITRTEDRRLLKQMIHGLDLGWRFLALHWCLEVYHTMNKFGPHRDHCIQIKAFIVPSCCGT
jgi:hypothetical protein